MESSVISQNGSEEGITSGLVDDFHHEFSPLAAMAEQQKPTSASSKVQENDPGMTKDTKAKERKLSYSFSLLLKDLKKYKHVKEKIQSVYEDKSKWKISIGVNKLFISEIPEILTTLDNYALYNEFLTFTSEEQGELLMENAIEDTVLADTDRIKRVNSHPAYNTLVGPGCKLLQIKNKPVKEILEDPAIRRLDDIQRIYKISNSSVATLACFAKPDNKSEIFGVTVKHLFQDNHDNAEDIVSDIKDIKRYVLSELHCKAGNGVDIEDIAFFSSSYRGCYGIVEINGNGSFIDIALLPLTHTLLDGHERNYSDNTGLLSIWTDELPVGMAVEKKGATTGKTVGKVVIGSVLIELGDMFGVKCENDAEYFAIPGDSGSLVIGHWKGRTYALGLVQQLKTQIHGHTNVVLCCRLDYCLNVLNKQRHDGNLLKLYGESLEPIFSLHNRYRPSSKDFHEHQNGNPHGNQDEILNENLNDNQNGNQDGNQDGNENGNQNENGNKNKNGNQNDIPDENHDGRFETYSRV